MQDIAASWWASWSGRCRRGICVPGQTDRHANVETQTNFPWGKVMRVLSNLPGLLTVAIMMLMWVIALKMGSKADAIKMPIDAIEAADHDGRGILARSSRAPSPLFISVSGRLKHEQQ
jgi:hypothetical protein